MVVDSSCLPTVAPTSHFTLNPFSFNEVFDALHSIDTKCSTGEDNFFIRLAASFISEYLTFIFNSILNQFPRAASHLPGSQLE